VVNAFQRHAIENALWTNVHTSASVQKGMPQNGEINTKFGVYKTACCGAEIIIREGAAFPDCRYHPKLTTVWKQIEVEVVDLITIKKQSQSDPAA
jgi:hypothetical protein